MSESYDDIDFESLFDDIDSLSHNRGKPTVVSEQEKQHRKRSSKGNGKRKTWKKNGKYRSSQSSKGPRLGPSGHPQATKDFFFQFEAFYADLLAIVLKASVTPGESQVTINHIMNFEKSERQQFYSSSEVVVNGKRIRKAQAHVAPLPKPGVTNYWTASSTASKRAAKAKKANEADLCTLRGIHSVISDVFCGGSGGEWFSSVKNRTRVGGSFRSTCGLIGGPHGIRVHYQVQKITEALRSNVPGATIEFLNGYPLPIDPCTIEVFKLLQETRRIPLLAEHIIYDEFLRIHTPIDLICFEVTPEGEVLSNFIELKTGYDGPFTSHVDGDKLMTGSMDNVWLTPYQLAAMQLLITMIMCTSRYGFCPSRGIIIHVPKQGTHTPTIHYLPTWSDGKEKRDLLVQDIIERLPKVAKQWLEDFANLVGSKIIKAYM